MMHEALGKVFGCGAGVKGCKVDEFGEPVHKDHDLGMSLTGLGKVSDEIHGHRVPCFGWNGEWLEEACWELVNCFVSLANMTGSNKVVGVCSR